MPGYRPDAKVTKRSQGRALVGYSEDDNEFYYINVDSFGNLKNKSLLWNTGTLGWEASTKGSGVGQTVAVENFPAVMSGTEIPISDVKANPTNEYKASDIDVSGDPEYYGFIKADGGWYVLRITDGNNLRYCRGDSDYSTNWGNRAISLEYSLFNLVF